jgi:hypothetical protein
MGKEILAERDLAFRGYGEDGHRTYVRQSPYIQEYDPVAAVRPDPANAIARPEIGPTIQSMISMIPYN